ncbi:cytochrome P450 [Mycobacterium shinjukuense]|uniref:Putative cytochrome P450 138 n=1 Tax=Mycobacterium shinjukuense TaxID=398694 RepID=A0A7I7MUA5_9MYCO|nr:cytochrome P450 [Mycobacterium shinjukuense]MCV6987050.1 cytochrome P450 [Mycobacterium shinjukuense]ORB68078.1 cytochrome P450 [Mycobacterium shinjukuense]BBX75771.1 putative cytochrome P450 138 [Mycobacterium shinjukuense]
MATATTDPVRLPPGPPWPSIVQGLAVLLRRGAVAQRIERRYGEAALMRLPILGKTVVVSDPALLKELFGGGYELLSRPQVLGEMLGPGSTFSLNGPEHRERRKLLVPPFHGKRMRGYESIVEQEVLRETAPWPEGKEFATLPSMMRITLNVILRTVFGASGSEFDELRELMPWWVPLGSRFTTRPRQFRVDLGPRSPWGRYCAGRRHYNQIVARLIAEARVDPALSARQDILALLLQARYDDGSPISDGHIADELLTLLAAGHETTATTLAWAIERIRRHPAVLSRLRAEVDAGGSEFRQAVIWEVQRVRPVVVTTGRVALTRIRLGDWVIPQGYAILANIVGTHRSERHYARADTFNPDRFVGNPPDGHSWVPFGGGVHRCIGAAFANMEMSVTLRTLLRSFDIVATSGADEPVRSRGIANAPGRGGRVVVHRRPLGDSESHDTTRRRGVAGFTLGAQ